MNRILLKPGAFAAVLFIAAHWGCSAGGALDPVDVPSLDTTSPSQQEAPEVPPSNPAGGVEIQFAANGTFLHNFNILDFRYDNKAKETALNTKMKGRYDEFYNSPETPICIKGINLTDVVSYEVDRERGRSAQLTTFWLAGEEEAVRTPIQGNRDDQRGSHGPAPEQSDHQGHDHGDGGDTALPQDRSDNGGHGQGRSDGNGHANLDQTDAHLGQVVHPDWKLQVVVAGDTADLFMFYVHGDELHFFELRGHMEVTKNHVYRY